MHERMLYVHILHPINVCTYVHNTRMYFVPYQCVYVCTYVVRMYFLHLINVCTYIRAYVVRMHFAPCHVCTNVRLLYFVRKSSTTESVHLCHDVLVCRTHVLLSVFIASYDYLYNIYL